jgi:hypothetical protein
MNAETRARELLAAQLPNQRKREVLLSGRPATYAGGITATQALRAICAALSDERGCEHMFPERGVNCSTCDEYHWHEDDRNMHELDDRLARIEEAVFPLEDSRRIWIAEARLPYMMNDRIPNAAKVTVTGPYRAGDRAFRTIPAGGGIEDTTE